HYDPVLKKGVNTRKLRPTLYDLLAFRAVNYFENDEKDLTQPAFAFTMNDEKDFAHATEFVNHSFTTQDRTSLQWKALKIYQQLLALHSNDANKDAFIDADLHRLNFVYANTILPNKKSLYQNALENIENNFSSNPLSGLASVR